MAVNDMTSVLIDILQHNPVFGALLITIHWSALMFELPYIKLDDKA